MAITREIFYTKDNTQDISLWAKVTEPESSLSKLIDSIAGGTYYIRSRTTDGTNYSDYTTEDSIVVAAPKLATPVLNAPTVVSDTQIDLSWSDVANESQYELQSSTDNATWTTEATLAANTVSYSDTGLTASTTYYYRLRAVGDGTSYATSDYSASVSATTNAASDTTAPSYITGYPTAANIVNTGFDVQIQIDEPGKGYMVVLSDAATAPTSAEVKAGTGAGGVASLASGSVIIGTASTTYSITASGLTKNTAYDVYVVAEDDEATPNLQASPMKLDVLTANNTLLISEDFSGTTIDTAQWTVTDPADAVAISQNNALLFDSDGTADVENPDANNVISATGYSNTILSMSFDFAFSGSNTNQLYLEMQADANNRIILLRDAASPANARLIIKQAGTNVYDFKSSTALSGFRWKILKDGDNISFHFWNGSTWIQVGTTQNYNLGTTFLPYFAMGAKNTYTAQSKINTLRLSNYNHSTREP